MQREPVIMVVVFLMALLGIGVVATWTDEPTTAATLGLGAVFGLCSIAFTQYLNERAALSKARRERLQEAQGLARALAAEIQTVGNVLLSKGSTLQNYVATERKGEEGSDPDDLLRYVELPSRVVFDANASKIALLGVVEELGELSPDEEGLVERVVGFHEGLVDFRSGMSAAKLQHRNVTQEEVSTLREMLMSRGRFAIATSRRLNEFTNS